MDKKIKQRVYEPPQARDLSAMSVAGGGPEGVCKQGDYPFYNCVAGPIYFASCAPGGTVDDSLCATGGYHTDPVCNFGASATTVCKSGAHQN